jgi:hypothetical protein
MAHENIDARRAEVARLCSYGASFTPVVIQALTEKFGCSPSAIRADIKLIAQHRKAPPLLIGYDATPRPGKQHSGHDRLRAWGAINRPLEW